MVTPAERVDGRGHGAVADEDVLDDVRILAVNAGSSGPEGTLSAVAAVKKMVERRGLEWEELVPGEPQHEIILLASNEIEADLVVLCFTDMTGLGRVLIRS